MNRVVRNIRWVLSKPQAFPGENIALASVWVAGFAFFAYNIVTALTRIYS